MSAKGAAPDASPEAAGSSTGEAQSSHAVGNIGKRAYFPPKRPKPTRRRDRAIQNYVRDKSHKVSANRAMRVLETAVGQALGKPSDVGGRGNKGDRARLGLSNQDAVRFRLLSDHRETWWPKLEEVPLLSRKQALERFEPFKPDQVPRVVSDRAGSLLDNGEAAGP